MALEIAELLKTKLAMLSHNEINFPSSESGMTRYIKKLELEKLQRILKGAENDEANDPKFEEKTDKFEEWQKLLRFFYFLEDSVESVLFTKTLKRQKLLILQTRLNYKIWRLRGTVSKLLEFRSSVTQPQHSIAPISEEDQQAVKKDFSWTNNPEDLQPSPRHRQTSFSAPFQPRKLLSRKWSTRRYVAQNVDDEAILQFLAKKLAQPLLSPAMLQFLMLKADISSPGKGILLWTVYNAETVKQYFPFRAWVLVSETSEEIDILKAIVEQAIDGKEANEETLQSLWQRQDTKEQTLQLLRQRLRNLLVPRRFLIVLYGDGAGVLWSNLKGAFPNSLSGSRVIVAIPHAGGSKPVAKALNERPQQSLAESSVCLEDSSISTAKAIIDDLTESILNPYRLLFLISVVEVVGSGEKTVLWPLYNAEDVKLHFHYRAWVHVPAEFKEGDLLSNILKQVTGIKMEIQLPILSLRQMLCNFLVQKRYLVVLYDVWTAEIWESIRLSLPNTMNGSRVILVVPEIAVAPRGTNSRIFNITPEKGFFHHFKGIQENAPDTRNAKCWDTLSDIIDEASGIVGLEDKIKELAQLALNSYNLHWLIPVLGVAGSGKTTLVKAFYNSIAAKQHFDCRAWINVPQDFDERDILLDLFRQLRKAKERQSLSLQQLQKGLGLFLEWKRYLIVLDDVRTFEIWKTLKSVLPTLSDGSRVILSMRKSYLAHHTNESSVILRMRTLDRGETLKLLSKTIEELRERESLELFPKMTGISEIPEELKGKIFERCRGLPLTILVLGGLLYNKNQSEWIKVIEETNRRGAKKKEITGRDEPTSGQSRMQKHETNDVAMATHKKKEAMTEQDRIETSTSEDQTDEMLSDMQAVTDLNMSYGKLSFSSKCCLLYMGLFPKQEEIRIRRLFKLWSAEGLLIQPTETNDADMAKSCFKELLKGKLIEITGTKSDGSPKMCRATNALHDSLFRNAEKFGFFHIQKSSDTSNSLRSTIRRLAGHLEKNPSENCTRHLRSYISFYKNKGDAPASGVDELLKGGFPMLAVLDLEGVYKPLLPETLGKLPKLKYLGLRGTYLDSIPESVVDLPDLETLDIKDTYITTLPGTLWKLRKLKHLYMSEIYVDVSIQKPSAWVPFNNLQTIWGLMIRRKIPDNTWLVKLRGLRKLKLTFHKASMEVIADWIPNLEHLQSLKLRSIDDSHLPAELKLGAMEGLKRLKSLYLLGKLNVNVLSRLPENLEILTLSVSELSVDPMEVLGKLQNLKVLRLHASSYTGTNMTCHSGGFPRLQVLKLWMLKELVNWTVDEKAMESLKKLEIRFCKSLDKVVGLENLPNLKKVKLRNMMNPPLIEALIQSIGRVKVFHKNLRFDAPWCDEENGGVARQGENQTLNPE